jgi:signal transduction histidine kinase
MARGRQYTYIIIGVVILSSLIFFLPLIILPSLPAWVGILLLPGFWGVCGCSVYYAERRVITWIDNAYQSEKAFISNASHELNNPLTAIHGECEISLLKERSIGEYQSALHRISKETSRIIRLMKHLMFLSKGENEILMAESETIILAEFIMTRFNMDRVVFYTDNFALMIKANPDLLKTAIENIIGNALKYSGDKEVEVRLRSFVLEIRDHGIGIPPEELSRVFQPFYRASNTRGYDGSGIGLSLSIHILRAYGAEVSITSVPGEGTKVRIEFS